MAKKSPAKKQSIAWRVILTTLLFGAAAYVLARNWHTVSISFDLAQHANVGWLGAGLALMAFTFLIAAGIYGVLAFKKLRYAQTVVIEVSTAFVNRLLPSGLGGLGIHGLYLYKRKHTAAEATVVISVNNLVGMVAHLLLLAAVILFQPDVVGDLFRKHHVQVPWQALLAILALLVILLCIPKVQAKLISFGRNLLQSIHKLRLSALIKALLLALLMTVTYTFMLLCAARSISVDLTLLQIFIIFSIGMLTQTATPTPGGLIGAEAGLYAGFVAYGVSPVQAGAAVLLYRLVSYWIPLLPGLVALVAARKKQLV